MNNTLLKLDILIPVSIDHEDRLRNLSITLRYLLRAGFKNIFVREYFSNKPKLTALIEIFPDVTFSSYENKDDCFKRFICVNELFDQSNKTNNKVACWYDADVLINKKSLLEATELIENNKFDIVYPYDGHFYDIPAETVQKLQHDLNTPVELEKCTLFNKGSWGGVALFSKKSFIEGGKGNPQFKNLGYEDDEFLLRFRKLGYRIGRTDGVLLHLNHFRGNTSFNYNNYTQNNINELTKVANMTVEELKHYIKSW